MNIHNSEKMLARLVLTKTTLTLQLYFLVIENAACGHEIFQKSVSVFMRFFPTEDFSLCKLSLLSYPSTVIYVSYYTVYH